MATGTSSGAAALLRCLVILAFASCTNNPPRGSEPSPPVSNSAPEAEKSDADASADAQAAAFTRQATERAAVIHKAALRALSANPDRCPTLATLQSEQGLESSQSLDPWGKTFRIDCDDDRVVVRSAGVDGKDGTSDDVTIPSSP